MTPYQSEIQKIEDDEEIISKTFPQNKLQETIYNFWRIRGWNEVKAVLGNLDVTFHKKPEYWCLGLDYIYLEQFYKEAKLQGMQLAHKLDLQNELRFLKGKDIKWLVHEADLGASHVDYLPIIKRIKAIKEELL